MNVDVEPGKDGATCMNCAFAVARYEHVHFMGYNCRRYAPTEALPGHYEARWPLVSSHDFCGEFRKRVAP